MTQPLHYQILRFEEYLRDKFEPYLLRLSQAETAVSSALLVTTFNDWLKRFQAQNDPWSPIFVGIQVASAVATPESSVHSPQPTSSGSAPLSPVPTPLLADAVMQGNTGVKRGAAERGRK